LNNFRDEDYRLFLATFIDKNIVSGFYNQLSDKVGKSIRGKLVESWNFHFTWHFFGECNQNDYNDILMELNPYFKEVNSLMEFKGIDAFPNFNNPNVIYLKVNNPDNQIFDLQNSLSKEIAKMGFKVEKKKFTPHITLVRIKEISDKTILKSFFDENKDSHFGEQSSFKINLVNSTLTPKGPVYKILK
jgi:2'-5' RNA ligase